MADRRPAPLPAGTIGRHPDVAFASADGFVVTLKGKSGHGAHPHLAVDCITAAAYLIAQLQTLVSREVAPVTPAVVSVGRIEGGTARTQLPDQVRLSGTIRSQSSEMRAQLGKAVPRLLEDSHARQRVKVAA
jgi:hippurate hydrolase